MTTPTTEAVEALLDKYSTSMYGRIVGVPDQVIRQHHREFLSEALALHPAGDAGEVERRVRGLQTVADSLRGPYATRYEMADLIENEMRLLLAVIAAPVRPPDRIVVETTPRKTFTVPEGYVAERDAEGRATGAVVRSSDAVWPKEDLGDGRWADVDPLSLSPADIAQMALCQLSRVEEGGNTHPHRIKVIRLALERLASSPQPPEPAAVRVTDAGDTPMVWCERCQGNGELVTDWDRYMHGHVDENGDEAVTECPDCDGRGEHAALSTALASARPEGWRLVPVEPTEAMMVAGLKEGDILGELVDWKGPDTATRDDIARVYRAMLAAAGEPK